jgi:elongator complex protein 1
VYEEEYLVNSVRRLVERVTTSESEAERLVFALTRRGMAERARAVEALMAEVMEACEKAVEQVFVPTATATQDNTDESKPTWQASGGDAVLQDWEAAQRKRTEPPVVKRMKKLTLLGS